MIGQRRMQRVAAGPARAQPRCGTGQLAPVASTILFKMNVPHTVNQLAPSHGHGIAVGGQRQVANVVQRRDRCRPERLPGAVSELARDDLRAGLARFQPCHHGSARSEDDARLIGDRYHHYKLVRKLGDREIAAYLIYPTTASHPDPYYMLEHKITNKVFNFVWDRVSGEPRVKGLPEALVPQKWRKDADGKPLDIDGADADLPVLGVTVPEAILVAEWLGLWVTGDGHRRIQTKHQPA